MGMRGRGKAYVIDGDGVRECASFAGRGLWREMEAVKVHEPRLYRAAWAIFGDSYEYLAKYEEFRKRMDDMQAGTPSLF